MHFDPFDKSFDALVVSDLERLQDVAEGWYVEYKRSPIASRNVGKSLCAFANHFGGWLIFGIEAPQRIPTAFPGLEPNEVIEVMASLRDAAVAHVNPTLVFETKCLEGPLSALGLPAGRTIVLAQIRQGRNPPYIHSSGRIYRRVADASDPKAETDRAVIDELTRRNREYRKRFRKHLKQRPEFSKAESKTPTMQLFLTHDPWQERPIKCILTHEQFAAIMQSKSEAAISVSLENTFPSEFGYTARQVAGNDPFTLRYTWQFRHGAMSSVIMPLRSLDRETAKGYKFAAEFFQQLPETLWSRVVDVTAIWLFLTDAIAKQDALAKAVAIEGSIFAKIRFLNVWRTVPYFDTASYIEHVRAHGIPVVQVSQLSALSGNDPDSLIEVAPLSTVLPEPKVAPFVRAALLLDWALGVLGVPHKVVTSAAELPRVGDLINRAVAVQQGTVPGQNLMR